MAQGAVKDTTGYVNYVYNISARGTTEVASQLMGLSGMASNILGQLAFQTSSYLSTTEGALLSMGVVATAGLTKATQQAMEFDQALSTIGAISGKTRDEVTGLGDQAMAMSSKFGVATSEMTEGLESLARAGVSTNNMFSILEQAMGLSKLEGLSLDTAINDLISTTNLLDTKGLDLSSPEYAEAVAYQNQKITATSEAAPINAQDIIHTLEHIGGYASSTNLDQDDLYAVIAQLGSKGTKSEMAGTSLRAFISAGQKDTAQRALDRIGLNVKDLWKDDETILSITDMKDVLDEAMESKGYTQQEKLEFYSDFAGYKQANQIMKIDTKSAREFKEKIDHSWDMGRKINQVIGTAETHVQGLIQAGTNLLTKVGEPFLPIVSTIAWTLKTGIDIINAIPGSNFIIAGGLVLASMKAISTIFNKIAPQLISAKGNIGGIHGLFTGIKTDLQESYTLLKNINNIDFIQNRAHKNEINRVTEDDKIKYWQKRTGQELYGMTDVYRLEKRHNFKDDTHYKDWKRREKYRRNVRQEQEVKPDAQSVKNETFRLVAHIDSYLDVINSDMQIIIGVLHTIKNYKDVTKTEPSNVKLDESIVQLLKDNVFKVTIVDSPYIVPVHEIGGTSWRKQIESKERREESSKPKTSSRNSRVSREDLSDEEKERRAEEISRKRKAKAKRKAREKRKFRRDFAGHFDEPLLDTASLFTDIREPTRKGELPKFYLGDNDISNLIDSMDFDFGFDLGTTEGQKAQKKLMDIFKKVAETNILGGHVNIKGGKRETLISDIKKELRDYMDVVRTTKVASLVMADTDAKVYSTSDLEKKLAIPKYFNPYKDKGSFTKDSERLSTAKEVKAVLEMGGNPLEVSQKKSVVANANELKNNFINDVMKKDPLFKKDVRQRKKGEIITKLKKMNNTTWLNYLAEQKNIKTAYEDENNESDIKPDDFNTRYEKALSIIEDENLGIDTDLSTALEKDSLEKYFHKAVSTNKNNNLGISVPSLFKKSSKLTLGGVDLNKTQLRSINSAIKEIYGKDFEDGKFREWENGLDQVEAENIVIDNLNEVLNNNSDREKRSKFIQSVYERIAPDKQPKKVDMPLFERRFGLDYAKFSMNELEALAYASKVDIGHLNLKNSRSPKKDIADAIAEQSDEQSIRFDVLEGFYSNKIANYFLNDLTSDAQQQFIKEVGLSNTNPYLAMAEFLGARENVKDGYGNPIKGEETGEILTRRKYSNSEEYLNRIKELGNIVEGEPSQLHLGTGNYSNAIHGKEGISKEPNQSTEHAIIMNGEEGFMGLNLHAKKVTDNMVEIAIQNAIQFVKDEIKKRTGQEISTQEAISLMPELKIPHSKKYHPHQYYDFYHNDLETTKRKAKQIMHDNSKGNEKDYSTYGAKNKALGRVMLIPNATNENKKFSKDTTSMKQEDVITYGMDEEFAGNRILEKEEDIIKSRDFKQFMLNSAFEEDRRVYAQRKPAKIKGLKATYQGYNIDMFSRDEATHGRNFENTAIKDKETGELLGFEANAQGDIREGYNWALERRRNRIYTQGRLAENFGTLAYKYGLSSQDIMDMGLTNQQAKKQKQLYEQQEFVNIPQYIEDNGWDAYMQLRGQMALSNVYRRDSSGNLDMNNPTNIFTKHITQKEYQRRLASGLIDISEGMNGILGQRQDKKTGEILYKVTDFESLHYSMDDIKAKILTEDIAWQKEMEETFRGLSKRDMNDPKRLAENILQRPESEMKKIINAIFIYNSELGNKLLDYAEKELELTVQAGDLLKVTPIDFISEEENLPSDFKKKKRQYLKSEDRKFLTDKYDIDISNAKNAKEENWIIRDFLDDKGLWDEAIQSLYDKNQNRSTRRERIPTPEKEMSGYTENDVREWIDKQFGYGASGTIDPALFQHIIDAEENPYEILHQHLSIMSELNGSEGIYVNPSQDETYEAQKDEFNYMMNHMWENEESAEYYYHGRQEEEGLPLEDRIPGEVKDMLINQGGYADTGESYNEQNQSNLSSANIIDPKTGWRLGSETSAGQEVYNPKTGKYEDINPQASRALKLNLLKTTIEEEEINSQREIHKTLKDIEDERKEMARIYNNSFLSGINVGDYNDIPIGRKPPKDFAMPGGLSSEDLKTASIYSRTTTDMPGTLSYNDWQKAQFVNNELNGSVKSANSYRQAREIVGNIKQQINDFISPKIDTVYGRFGERDNSEIVNKIGDFSDKIFDTTEILQGFSAYLQEAAEVFPPLSIAVLGLETVISTITKINEGTQGLQSFLSIGDMLKDGKEYTFLNKTFTKDNAAGKLLMSATGMIGEAFETLTTIFWDFLGPIALITAGLVAIKGVLDWSYQSHKKYLESLQEDQKEKRSKSKGLQVTNENAQEAARNNRAPRQQDRLNRNAELAQTRLDNANMTRAHGAIEITRQKNDTLWGDYGIAAGLGKLQGNYESTASEYDGTTGQIRRIKEATLANPFSSGAMNQVSSYYDANQLAFGVMDEYKDELGKLYDAETSAMLKYHSDDVRGSPEFNKALDDFVEATGITRDHAQQYLDYMQTEHNVDKATQTMQAQADQIAASTELKVQAIAFGGNPADVLGLNGIEAQQDSMIKAQADMIKMELSGQLWWKAVWSTITTPIKLILSPIFIIVDLLNAIWSLMTGNIGGAFESGGRAASRLNVFGEAATYWGAWADTESTDFNAIGQGATDSYNRANYGNVEQPASGGYHPTHYIDSNQGNDRRESQTHYINANRGSYHFINSGGSGGSYPTAQLNPLSSIGTMLSTIISILTTGLLVGGGIYGLTKFLKSDLSLGDLGKGIFTTLKGGGANLLDSIFKEGTILGKVKDKANPFVDVLRDSFGTRKEQIGGFGSNILKKIKAPFEAYKERPDLYEGTLMDKFMTNPWTTYANEKFEQGKSALGTLKDEYAAPWKEYLGNKYDEKKNKAKGKVKDYLSNLKTQAELYNDNPTYLGKEIYDRDNASMPVKILGKAFDVKNKVFGKVANTDFEGLLSNPKEFLSDPRNIETMAKDIYKNNKGRLNPLLSEAQLYNTYPTINGESTFNMENAKHSPLAIKATAKALKWKDKYLQGDSIQDVLKDPERTVDIIKGTYGDIQGGALDDISIEVKDKVSDLFGKVKEGMQEGIESSDEDDGLLGNAKNKLAGIFNSKKSKLAGWFDGGEEEYDWYKNADAISFGDLSVKNKAKAIGDKAKDTIMDSRLFDWYRKDPDEEYEWYQNADAMEFGDLSGKNQLRAILDTKGEALKENGLSSLNTDFGIGEHIQGKITKKADNAKNSLNEKVKSSVSTIKGKFKKEKIICQFCGHENPAGAEFCEACGMPINQDTIEKGKENSKKMLKTQGSLLTQMHMPGNIPQNAAQPNAHTNSQNMAKEQGSMLTKMHSSEAIHNVALESEFEFCDSCGGVVHKGDEFCNWCGARVTDADAFCPECGAAVGSDDDFCQACGTALNPLTKKQKVKQKVTDLIHKFEDKINGKENIEGQHSLQRKVNKTMKSVQDKMAGVDKTTADENPNSLKNRHKRGEWSEGMLDHNGISSEPLTNMKMTTLPENTMNETPMSRIKAVLQGPEGKQGAIVDTGSEKKDVAQAYKEKGISLFNRPKYPKYYDPNLIYKEEMPGAYADGASVLNLDNLGDMNDGLKTGGKIAQKAGGFLKGKGGKLGKVGNVLNKVGGGASKAGTKGVGSVAKGGAGKLAKTGVGKAVSGIGKKAIGGIGKKLATKGIAQVGSKVLGGALMATGIGAPLGLLLESPIGGALIEGAMDLGGKALGAIGGAIGGVGNAIGGLLGFGKKTHYQQAGGGTGGGLGGLGALGGMGMAAIAGPLGMGVGLLSSIFKNNRDHKNESGNIGSIAKNILKNVVSGNKQKANNSSGGNITIQNININTADDPEAIKAMFLELLIELQEQVNPRLVSRTVGEPPATSSTDTNTPAQDANAQNNPNDPNATNNNNNNNGNNNTTTN